jgi:hypothetical protein
MRVMPAHAGIHVFRAREEDVDGRDKPGHDGWNELLYSRAAQAVKKRQVEIR